jgi:hypothetical protein
LAGARANLIVIEIRLTHFVFGFADGDQFLAAEPSFHSDPLHRGWVGICVVRSFSNHNFIPLKQQPENGFAQ